MTSQSAVASQPPLPRRVSLNGRVAQTPRSRPLLDVRQPMPAPDAIKDDDKRSLAEAKDVNQVSAVADSTTNLPPSGLSALRSAGPDRPPPVSTTTPPTPFPPRPGHYSADGNVRSARALVEDMSSANRRETRPQAQEPPAESLQLPNHKPVDYYPWSANHPEDTLSDQTIKSGFQNKPLVTNETNNAALKPSFKPFKSSTSPGTQNGPHTQLSSLFVAVLDKRQSAGRITGPSTAKAPPRVSLTSTRREAWLQDLSNPTVPLKKLNRTIPFGVTGKVLLEQCLMKNIPLPRAIWLSKAVGINELRAYKRKGTTGPGAVSGELKWIREWTVNVTQFIESTSDMSGQPDFKTKMQYAVGLSAHLFAENLLDQGLFADWLLTITEKSRIERLPLWLLLVQVYWKHLVSARKRGRRLAHCLFAKLQAAVSSDAADLLGPVIKRMQLLLATLAIKNKGCMIMPDLWPEYQPLLAGLDGHPTFPDIRPALEELDVRNQNLARGTVSSNKESIRRKSVIDLLDNANVYGDFDALFDKCYESAKDLSALASTALEWSTSKYRSGSHHVYLALRILRKLCDSYDVDLNPLTTTLLSGKRFHSFDFSKVLWVISELVRTSHFSVGRFCQSLILRGALWRVEDGSKSDEQLISLLQQLPTDTCPDGARTLQRNLLRDAGRTLQPTPTELSTIRLLMADMSTNPVALASSMPMLHLLSFPAKFILRTRLAERLRSLEAASAGPEVEAENYEVIKETEFCALREVIETLGDVGLVAQLLKVSLGSNDSETMVLIIETLQYHRKCLSAVGVFQPLVDVLVKRYQNFRMKTYLDKPLVSAMDNLFATLEVNEGVMLQLQHDLAQCHQRATLVMCSPASDNAVDVLMADDVDSDAEIDRILTSGTSMDEKIVARVFKRITSRVNEGMIADISCTTRCGQWFTRLRAFDHNTFDNLMQEWMTQTMRTHRTTCLSMVPTLVDSGCTTLASFTQCVSYCRASAKSDRSFCAELELDTLQLLLSKPPVMDLTQAGVRYKFRLEQQKFVEGSAGTILSSLQRVIHGYAACKSEIIRDRFRQLLQTKTVTAFLVRAAVHSQRDFRECLCTSPAALKETAVDLGQELIHSLLALDSDDSLQPGSLQLWQLFDAADELSLPLCQLELLRLLQPNAAPMCALPPSLAPLQCNLVDLCALTTVWRDLLVVLGPITIETLCKSLEEKCLRGMDSVVTWAASNDLETGKFPDAARNAVRESAGILEALAGEQWSPKLTTFHFLLKSLIDALSRMKPSSAERDPCTRPIAECTYRLLRLFVLSKAAWTKPQPAGLDIFSFISSLCTLVTLPALHLFPDILQLAVDAIASFSDDLSDEPRTLLFQRYHHDPQLAFILGGGSNAQNLLPAQDSCLALVTSTSSTSAPSGAGPTSVPAASPAASRFAHQGAASGTTRLLPSSAPQQPTTRPALGLGRPASSQAQQKQWNPPAPFAFRRWEVLPDAGTAGTAAGGNDTSISLALFGARKVG